MYDELDIFEKECSNDQFRFECMIECMCMDSEMSLDEYTTESQGAESIVTKIKNKVTEIIDKVRAAIKTVMIKISNFFTTKKLKAKYDDLLNGAKAIESSLEKREIDHDKLSELFDKRALLEYDMAKVQSSVKNVGDYITAAVKTIASKIKGGEKVTSDDIANVRREAYLKWRESGFADGDEKRNYKKVKHIRDIKSFLTGVGGYGIISFIVSKFDKTNPSWSVTDTVCSAISGISYVIIANAGDEISRRDIKPTLKEKRRAEDESKFNANQSINYAVTLASLTSVIQEVEAMSYRQGIKCLTKNLNEIEGMIRDIERISTNHKIDDTHRKVRYND
nr:MAG TPA: hypothetical protein [Caudoviricetes sp.]